MGKRKSLNEKKNFSKETKNSNPKKSNKTKIVTKCPKCGGTDYIPIAYGRPTHEGLKLAREGKIILAGCVIRHNSKHRYCKQCRTSY